MREVKHLSHSSITAADECLYKYYLTRIAEDKLPNTSADARDIGILAHAYIEAFFKGEDFLSKLIEQPHSTHHQEAYAIFEKWKRGFTVPEDAWLYTEREGRCKVDGCPDLIGYDDFVYQEGEYTVFRDFKSGWGTDVYPSYEFELHLAMLRYEAENPGAKMKAEIEFVRRSKVVRLQRKIGYDGAEDLVWNEELRSATIARVKAAWGRIKVAYDVGDKANAYDTWNATPGTHCTFCPAVQMCATARAAQAANMVAADKETAERMLREIILMDEATDKMKASLRAYVDVNGSVVSGNGKYDYEAKFSGGGISRSFSDARKVLEIAGDAVGKALKIDLKIKDGQALLGRDDLKGLVVEKKSPTRFVVGKKSAKEADDED